jgi:hypothetical protein
VHQNHGDVVNGDAAGLQVEIDREGEAERRIDLALGQHRLAHREADVLEPHGLVVEHVDGLEDRPLGVGAIGRRRAELLADQALRVGRHTLALAPDDGERRRVVEGPATPAPGPLDRGSNSLSAHGACSESGFCRLQRFAWNAGRRLPADPAAMALAPLG